MTELVIKLRDDSKLEALLDALRRFTASEGVDLAVDSLERRTVIEPALAEASQRPQPRNEAMFAVLQRSAERMKDVPVTGSTEGTLKLIREARAGAMWGYEPTDTDD
jgi:hypothetical protein